MPNRFKLLLLLFFSFFLVFFVGSNSIQFADKSENGLLEPVPAQTPCKNCKRSNGKKNRVANVDSLMLSTERITTPCPPGSTPGESATCTDTSTVNVTVKATDKDKDILIYNYTVSGGQIIGSGAKVVWDLSGVQPGTYTITAGVDDGCGICGKTITKTVTVESCNCSYPCVAPTVAVVGPSSTVTAGESLTFTADTNNSGVFYNWNVSSGTIIAGQGTPSITVDTTDLEGQNVTATVEVSNECGAKTESATVEVKSAPLFSNYFGVIRVQVRRSNNQPMTSGVRVTIEAVDPRYEIEPQSTIENINGIYEFRGLPSPVLYKITATTTNGTSKNNTAVSDENSVPVLVNIRF